MFTVEMSFRGDLGFFLHQELRGLEPIRRKLREKTAVKDVIEACGVPHPEVDLIVATQSSGAVPPIEKKAVDFAWSVQSPVRLEIYSVPAPAEILPAAPRLQQRTWTRFIVDGHLGSLARDLRLLGIDTAYENNADDRQLLARMLAENRALLTRDRRLLMHSIVRNGFSPRSTEGERQTREVLRRFGCAPQALAPYRRCLRCNGLLETVPKSEVMGTLGDQPLTLRYYNDFRRCPDCGRLYWQGSHFARLAARLQRILEGF